MGRPKLEIDEEEVIKLASIHCTMEEIGYIVGCSVDTLENRFSESIKEGRARGRASLRRMQYEAAKKGNATMLIWLGKQLLGQRDAETLNASLSAKDNKLIIELGSAPNDIPIESKGNS